MTIEYKDSKRIVASGIGTELTGIGGWKEVGRTTLGSADANILVSSLDDKRYYMILYADKGQASNGTDVNIRLNGDTGSNYSYRRCGNGGNDATDVSTATSYGIWAGNAVQTPIFGVFYLSNKSDKEKLWQGHAVTQHTAGAGNDPERSELVTKWANTSNAVSSITANGTSNLTSGSEVVVLGWDTADTHTTNFWEELGSTVLTTNTTGSWGVTSFTPKKYLWVQIWGYASTDTQLRYGTGGSVDTGSNYAGRVSFNGGSDTLDPNATHTQLGSFLNSNKGYANIFIINNSANEKLSIMHSINAGTAGAGNYPSRTENVSKWTNTSGQIDTIKFEHSSATWYTGCTMKVWGSN